MNCNLTSLPEYDNITGNLYNKKEIDKQDEF